MNDGSSNLRELFEQALALDASERAAFLSEQCTDPTLRHTLQRMLEVDQDDAGSLLDRSLDELLDEVGDWTAVAPLVGSSVGPFRLLERLGDGGSSIVFRAEREQAGVSQQVALKLLRRGLHSAEEQRRFRDERRALAQLQHPGIARLIEGDITDEGTPYIALELVEGTSIIEHARTHRFDLRQRLGLFIAVCRAVEAAHRALIVHRDLKPSNVLVTAEGEIKLLDFGIAKLLVNDANDDAADEQHLAMTPAYAAPEQFARGQITTATDVYALGVVLGELITGQRREPGDSRTPSAQLDNSASSSIAVDERTESPRALRRKLRGDLDDIVLKATATEPEQRYASAGTLAEDIARYLGGQPVIAHAPSRLYRARKFVGRHRGGVATTLLFLVAILTALGLALWQANVARDEAQRATSVRDFLIHVFNAAEPAGPRLAPPSVVDVVRVSIVEAQRSKSLYPAVRIELLEELGGVLRGQGDLDGSIVLLDANYRDAMTTLGPTQPLTLQAGLGLARALAADAKSPQARTLLDTLLQQSTQLNNADLRARLLSASALLGIDRFERERAHAESKEAIDLCKQGCNEATRIQSLLVRGNVLASFQQDAAAIPVLEDALSAQRLLLAGPHVNIADIQQSLSRAYRRQGQFDRAETMARESLATVEASVPDPHMRRTDALDTLRQVLIDSRRFDEAEALGLRIIAMDKATLGPAHRGVATSENTLGYTYMMAGNFALAAEHYREALTLSESIPDNQRRSAIYQSNLGVSLGRGGDPTTGMRLIRTSIEALRAQEDPDYGEICSALEKLGALQRFSSDAKAAYGSYAEADQLYTKELADAPPAWRVVSLVGLGRSALDLGDDARAADAFEQALVLESTPVDRVSPDRIEARTGLAGILHRRGDAEAARKQLDQALAEREAAHGILSPSLQTFVDSVAASMASP